MTDSTTTTLRGINGAATIYLPVKMVQDTAFPFSADTELAVHSVGGTVVVFPAARTLTDTLEQLAEVRDE